MITGAAAREFAGAASALARIIQSCDSNQAIAETLVLSIDTVKRHVSNIFSKLGVNNRVQAVARVRALGLLSDEP